LRGVGQSCGWKQSGGGKRLQQCASVHVRNCNRGLQNVKRRSDVSEAVPVSGRKRLCVWPWKRERV
jgi:hypothetical protein